MAEPIWETKEGQKIPVSKMTDHHILNAYRFLQRQVVEYQQAFDTFFHPVLGPTPGSMAEYCAEQEIETYPAMIANFEGWMEILAEDIQRRNLKVPPPIEAEPLPEFEFVDEYKGARIYKIKGKED